MTSKRQPRPLGGATSSRAQRANPTASSRPSSSRRFVASSSLSSSKSALRAHVRTLPGATPAESALDQCALMETDLWAAAFNIALYRSLPGEVATDLLFADAARLGMDITVPVSTPSGKTYIWRRITPKTLWHPGPHGIEEPTTSLPGRPTDLRLILVPGVAFDPTGRRLGHGTGTYDRLLAKCPDAFLLGLCPASRLLPPDTIPFAPHDIPVDAILTNGHFHFTPSAEAKLARIFGFPPPPPSSPSSSRPLVDSSSSSEPSP